tara:strand:- start:82 stop:657 length:576 start_codon:yes stop_codon:yes gene_type:complete
MKGTKYRAKGGSMKGTKYKARGGGMKSTKGMARGGALAKAGKKIAGGFYKAKTGPLQVASKVTKTLAPKSKLAKGLDRIADPKIFKAMGGAMKSTKGMAKGGAALRAEMKANPSMGNMPASVMSALSGQGTRKAGSTPMLRGTKGMAKGGAMKGTKGMARGGAMKSTKGMARGGGMKGTKYKAKGGGLYGK